MLNGYLNKLSLPEPSPTDSLVVKETTYVDSVYIFSPLILLLCINIEELYQLSIFWSGKHEQTSCEQLSGVQDGGPSPASGHMMERAQPCKKYVRNLLKIFANVYTEV